ncbi:unnamed protein product [marine sediment metagenome]|uniref:Uncharacterized protein n=1 Tax=marine sediment metagenome TaxID=412755 RepID=X0SRH5_9ZZZZ
MKTHNGYIIKMYNKSPSLKVIVTEGKGGKIPNDLTGMYTTDKLAMVDIDKYLDKKGGKRDKAKTNNTAK